MQAPVELGSSEIPAPADNHPDEPIGGRWFPTLTSGQPGYYLIRVTGTVTHSWNPACDPLIPALGCARNLDGVTLGPLDAGGASFISVGYLPPGWTPEGGRQVIPEYLQPDLNVANSGVVLVRYDHPQTVWVRRSVNHGCLPSVWNTCAEERQPQYFLTSDQRITLSYVATPIAVEGPTGVAADQEGMFTGQVVDGLSVDSWAPGHKAVWWTFFEGDTLGNPGSGTPVQVYECQGRMSCSYDPQTGGRMQMVAYVHGRYLEAFGNVVREQESRLELSCPPSVERGNPMRCTVAANPAGTLTDIQWSFSDTAGHVVRDSGRAEWTGTMVVGGRINVTARLSGTPVASDTPIAVTPRRWPRISVVAVDSGNGHLPAQPRFIYDLADTHPPIPDGPIDIDTITSGPNAGWAYLALPITRVRAIVHISGGFRPGTPLYQMQRWGTDPVTGQPFCRPSQFSSDVEQGARQHEGLIAGPSPSHVSVYRQWYRNNTPQTHMEAVAGFLDDFSVDYPFQAKVEVDFDTYVSRPAKDDPNQMHTTDSPPGLVPFPSVPCMPRLYP